MALTFVYRAGHLVAIHPGERPPTPKSRFNKLELPCIHLGAATGETRKCSTCQGDKYIPLHGCAQHGECTVERSVYRPGEQLGETVPVSWCRTCPDYRGASGTPADDKAARTAASIARLGEALRAQAGGLKKQAPPQRSTPSPFAEGALPDVASVAVALGTSISELAQMTRAFTPAQMRELAFHATARALPGGDPVIDLSCMPCCSVGGLGSGRSGGSGSGGSGSGGGGGGGGGGCVFSPATVTITVTSSSCTAIPNGSTASCTYDGTNTWSGMSNLGTPFTLSCTNGVYLINLAYNNGANPCHYQGTITGGPLGAYGCTDTESGCCSGSLTATVS